VEPEKTFDYSTEEGRAAGAESALMSAMQSAGLA
jgi:hypothetical protein